MKIIPDGIRRPLSHPDYKLFAIGQVFAVFSFWMQSVTSSWLVYSLTETGALLGIVTSATLLPSLFLAPIGGLIADKFTKKHVIYCTQTVAIITNLVTATLILTGLVQVWHVVVHALVFGTMIAIESPVRNSYMVELVGKEDLRSAIALNASMFNLGRMVGPTIGGILIPLIGIGPIYLLTALGFSAINIALYKISVDGKPVQDNEKTKHSILDGFIYAFKEKQILYTLLLVATISVFMSPTSVLLPLVTVEILSGESVLLGLLNASLGIGAFTAAFFLATRQGDVIKWITIGYILFLFGLFSFSLSENIYLSVASLMCAGGGAVLVLPSCNTVLQLVTPDKYRGRVMSLFTMMVMGMGIFGASFAGYSADIFGIHSTLLFSASCASILGSFIIYRLLKIKK